METFTLYLEDVAPQNTFDRSMEGTLNHVGSLSLSDLDITIPEIISVSPYDGTIAVFDYGSMKLHLIETDNDHNLITHTVSELHAGSEEGEFSNPTEILFVDNDRIAIADPGNSKLIFTNLAGEFVDEITLSESPHRMVMGMESLITGSLISDHLFSSVDIHTGESKENFGKMNRPASPRLKQGDLSAQRGKIAFIPYESSWFTVFTEEGDLLFQRETIRSTIRQQVVDDPRVNSSLSSVQGNNVINTSIQMSDDTIAILHSGKNPRNLGNLIDFYTLHDGSYLGTYQLDTHVNLIRIHHKRNTLFTRHQDADGRFEIKIYDMQGM